MDPLLPIQQLLSPFSGELIAFGLTLFATMIAGLLRPKVKLIWGRSNNSLHMVPAGEKRVEIYAEKFYLQNTGRKPATEVEFVLSSKPNDLSVWQPRQYKEETTPNGDVVVTLPFIAPGELVIIDTVYIDARAASVVSVKCAETLAKQVPFVTQRRFGTFVMVLTAILMLSGAAFLLRILGIIIFGM